MWLFEDGNGERASVRVTGRLRANNAEALLQAALGGLGLGIPADFLAADHLRAGRLVEVMPGWRLPETGIYVVHADRAYTPLKIRALVDFLEQRFRRLPWERVA